MNRFNFGSQISGTINKASGTILAKALAGQANKAKQENLELRKRSLNFQETREERIEGRRDERIATDKAKVDAINKQTDVESYKSKTARKAINLAEKKFKKTQDSVSEYNANKSAVGLDVGNNLGGKEDANN